MSTKSIAVIAAVLTILVVAVFGRTAGYGFVAFDDPSYVTDNSIVQRGLTVAGLRWALTTSDAFYWHPLTWLSHMIDCQFYGLRPGGHHVTNVLIHAATTLLVFAAFLYMTGAAWRSGIVAAVFAVHPLNVEPVAWIAERKELLAGFFWFATVLAYAWYARRPTWRRYALVVVGFVLGLMSKPVVVTLPIVLLLLDVWPLGRVRVTTAKRLIIEKAPLLALSAASSALTYVGQQRAGAMILMAHVPFADRVQHAIVAYATYVGQIYWPYPLAVLYPYQPHNAVSSVLVSAVLLAAITALAIRLFTRAPFLISGWLWFAGVLVPMIGLIQVGAQSHADRFTYIPAVGLSVMAVWGGAQLLEQRRWIAAFVAGGAIATLAVAASAQTRYWTDSVTLMTHTVAVTEQNPVALHLLAFSLAADGRLIDAVPAYRASLRLKPRNPLALYNLGLALAALHKPREAAESFAEALRLSPSYAEAHYSLGATLMDLNRLPEARSELEAALRLPMSVDYSAQAAFRLGLIGAYQGDIVRARDGFQAALRFQPGFAEARVNLERALTRLQNSNGSSGPRRRFQ
jgi:tetratricopeptide (TPR) repeat protein